MSNPIEVSIIDNGLTLEVIVFRRGENGNDVAAVGEGGRLTWQTIGECEEVPRTMVLPFRLGHQFLVAAAKESLKMGLRKPDESESRGEMRGALKAQTEHLKDLRKLVFKGKA